MVQPSTYCARQGIALLFEVLALLPKLQGIVFSGRTAQHAQGVLRKRRPDLFQLQMPHPSPLSICSRADVANRITATLKTAKSYIR